MHKKDASDTIPPDENLLWVDANSPDPQTKLAALQALAGLGYEFSPEDLDPETDVELGVGAGGRNPGGRGR